MLRSAHVDLLAPGRPSACRRRAAAAAVLRRPMGCSPNAARSHPRSPLRLHQASGSAISPRGSHCCTPPRRHCYTRPPRFGGPSTARGKLRSTVEPDARSGGRCCSPCIACCMTLRTPAAGLPPASWSSHSPSRALPAAGHGSRRGAAAGRAAAAAGALPRRPGAQLVLLLVHHPACMPAPCIGGRGFKTPRAQTKKRARPPECKSDGIEHLRE